MIFFSWNAEEIERLGDATEGYAVKKLLRPYLVSAGLEDGVKYIFTMNPYMSELLSKSEFIQTDITYNVSTEFMYSFSLLFKIGEECSLGGFLKTSQRVYILSSVMPASVASSANQILTCQNGMLSLFQFYSCSFLVS